jgi:Na+-translocating ferredoxin:NAD+ oxidoreductase RnfG subunit
MEVTKMKKNSGLTSGLVLLTFGLICGLLLALVNGFTKDRIAAEELRLKKQVIAEYYDIEEYYIEVEEFEEGTIETIFIIKTSESSNEIEAIAYSASAQGYGGLVNVLVVVNSDLEVEDYAVISDSESGPGTVISSHDFNYTQADSLGGFNAIAGATYSTNAMRTVFEAVASRVETDMGVE